MATYYFIGDGTEVCGVESYRSNAMYEASVLNEREGTSDYNVYELTSDDIQLKDAEGKYIYIHERAAMLAAGYELPDDDASDTESSRESTRDSADEPVVSEVAARIVKIHRALSVAFGGSSQVPYSVMGEALAGNIDSAGLGYFGTVEELALLLVAEFDKQWDRPAGTPDIAKASDACRNALIEMELDPSALPYRPYRRPEL